MGVLQACVLAHSKIEKHVVFLLRFGVRRRVSQQEGRVSDARQREKRGDKPKEREDRRCDETVLLAVGSGGQTRCPLCLCLVRCAKLVSASSSPLASSVPCEFVVWTLCIWPSLTSVSMAAFRLFCDDLDSEGGGVWGFCRRASWRIQRLRSTWCSFCVLG